MQLVKNLVRRKSTAAAHCAIGDFHVSIQSDLRQVLDDFTAMYPGRDDAAMLQDRVIRLEVRRAGRTRLGRSLFQVYADGEEVGGRHTGEGIFPLVEWGINLRIMATRSEFVQLHAASMSYQGNGFIFAGDSGCGKSTLAAVLLAHGWQYLCDEFALVSPDLLVLNPFPKALCIKSGSYEVIRNLRLPFARRRDYVKAFKGRVGYISPHLLGAHRIGHPVSARYVMLPIFQPDALPSLTPIARAEAATELYRCCFNKSALPECGLPTLSRLVQHAECFRLVVGSPSETASLLKTLCTKSPVQEAQPVKARTVQNPRAIRGIDRIASRREALKIGAKLAYVAPVVLTLTSRQAFAAASNPSGICSTANHTGQLCETDLDCCSRTCNLGVCR